MLSTKTKAKAGAKGTWMLVKHPTLRRATVGAAKPTVKLGLKLKSRQLKTEQTAKKRVLPALAIGAAIVAILVILELGCGPPRKGPGRVAGGHLRPCRRARCRPRGRPRPPGPRS